MSSLGIIKGNKWSERLAAKNGNCIICHKPTTTCLIHMDSSPTIDWFYTCPLHLKNPGFATLISKKEHNKAQENENENEKSDNKDENKSEENKNDIEDDEKVKSIENMEDNRNKKEKAEEATDVIKKLSFNIYELHRDIFYLRESRIYKQIQNKKAIQIQNQFPSVPKHIPK